MAKCQGTPPCGFSNDVHDHGCRQRAAGISDPELAQLYLTETPTESQRLDDVLSVMLMLAPVNDIAADLDTTDVTGGDAEWVVLRRAIREGKTTQEILELATVTVTTYGAELVLFQRPVEAPVQIGSQFCPGCGTHVALIATGERNVSRAMEYAEDRHTASDRAHACWSAANFGADRPATRGQ